LTLTSDDLESDIIVNDSSTLTNTTIWFVAALSLIVDVRTDGQTLLPGLLGHLWGDDLKSEWWDVGMVMCLGQGAGLYMAQMMPLPLTISCSRLVLPSWFYLSSAGSPR